jgi:hypothetical protein
MAISFHAPTKEPQMNTIKSAAALAAFAVALSVSGCASLQSADSNDILASMAHDSSTGGE